MKRKLTDNTATADKQNNSGAQNETAKASPTAQSWKDRLHAKTASQQKGWPGMARNIATGNIGNRSENTSSGNTARKAKKGHRPG